MTFLDFTAIDFETANFFLGSPCAIGMVKIRGGKVVDDRELYFRPPRGFDTFDKRNYAIHKIRPETLVNKPQFDGIASEIIDFIAKDTVVAHNINFDLGVFTQACQVSQVVYPQMVGACTVEMSRSFYKLESNSLKYAAPHSGFDLTNHHNALHDAQASAHIMLDIAHQEKSDSVEELYAKAKKKLKIIDSYENVLDIPDKTRQQIARFNKSTPWLL